MAGKPPVKVFEYTNKGDYIRSYDTLKEARNAYYSDILGNKPMFEGKKSVILGYKIHITPKDTVLLMDRPGKEKIRLLYRIYNSKLCNFNISKSDNKPIILYNLKGEPLAEFANLKVASEILDNKKFPPQTRYHQVTNREKSKKQKELNSDYYFEYKD